MLLVDIDSSTNNDYYWSHILMWFLVNLDISISENPDNHSASEAKA